MLGSPVSQYASMPSNSLLSKDKKEISASPLARSINLSQNRDKSAADSSLRLKTNGLDAKPTMDTDSWHREPTSPESNINSHSPFSKAGTESPDASPVKGDSLNNFTASPFGQPFQKSSSTNHFLGHLRSNIVLQDVPRTSESMANYSIVQNSENYAKELHQPANSNSSSPIRGNPLKGFPKSPNARLNPLHKKLTFDLLLAKKVEEEVDTNHVSHYSHQRKHGHNFHYHNHHHHHYHPRQKSNSGQSIHNRSHNGLSNVVETVAGPRVSQFELQPVAGESVHSFAANSQPFQSLAPGSQFARPMLLGEKFENGQPLKNTDRLAVHSNEDDHRQVDLQRQITIPLRKLDQSKPLQLTPGSGYSFLHQRRCSVPYSELSQREHFFMLESVNQFNIAIEMSKGQVNMNISAPMPSIRRTKPYMLVLDLDETLVHAEQVVANSKPTANSNKNFEKSFLFSNADGSHDVIGITFRPHLKEFLARASALFDLVVFTASLKDYADAVLDHLDPQGQLFSGRLYREHCILIGDKKVKNMGMFSSPETIIVDNLLYSFAFNIDQGLPIISFIDDTSDVELLDLAAVLEHLPTVGSPKKLLTEVLGLAEFYRELSNKLSSP